MAYKFSTFLLLPLFLTTLFASCNQPKKKSGKVVFNLSKPVQLDWSGFDFPNDSTLLYYDQSQSLLHQFDLFSNTHKIYINNAIDKEDVALLRCQLVGIDTVFLAHTYETRVYKIEKDSLRLIQIFDNLINDEYAIFFYSPSQDFIRISNDYVLCPVMKIDADVAEVKSESQHAFCMLNLTTGKSQLLNLKHPEAMSSSKDNYNGAFYYKQMGDFISIVYPAIDSIYMVDLKSEKIRTFKLSLPKTVVCDSLLYSETFFNTFSQSDINLRKIAYENQIQELHYLQSSGDYFLIYKSHICNEDSFLFADPDETQNIILRFNRKNELIEKRLFPVQTFYTSRFKRDGSLMYVESYANTKVSTITINHD